ncbi:unnamed protein product [Lathyrus sativus]|nr:unnamed protein product [Lathyrus sativus]
MRMLISSIQTTFIKGRKLLNRVLVLNEIVDLAKRSKRIYVLLKVDFEKAYDCMDWTFLKKTIVEMGFGAQWIKWMEETIMNSYLSVLINGSPTQDFKVSEGLRQGDPLSSFLFSMVGEVLKLLVKRVVDAELLKDFKINNRVSYNILQYAVNTIIICDGARHNLWALKLILKGYGIISGLKINIGKTSLFGIGVEDGYLNAT